MYCRDVWYGLFDNPRVGVFAGVSSSPAAKSLFHKP